MRKKVLKNLLIYSIATVLSASSIFSTTVDANSQNTRLLVTEDSYQKAITKGFLGRGYGVGGGRYLCNTYVESALENVSNLNLNNNMGFKDIQISKGKKGTATSQDWTNASVRLTYTDSIYNEESQSYEWNDKTTVSLLTENKGTKLKNLALGDVLTYGSNGGHVALYFGEYEDKEDVYARLIELGIYKKSDLKKSRDRYSNKKGRPIIREYEGSGTHWRIHATSKGLLIDNAIQSRSSNGTSSFGKWSKSVPSGIAIYNELEEY